MTIDEAIELLKKDLADNYYNPGSKLFQAVNLGIEALKAISSSRRLGLSGSIIVDLPGETEE